MEIERESLALIRSVYTAIVSHTTIPHTAIACDLSVGTYRDGVADIVRRIEARRVAGLY